MKYAPIYALLMALLTLAANLVLTDELLDPFLVDGPETRFAVTALIIVLGILAWIAPSMWTQHRDRMTT